MLPEQDDIIRGALKPFQWRGVPSSVPGASQDPASRAVILLPLRVIILVCVCLYEYIRVALRSCVLVRFAPCDPGARVLSPLCRSALSHGFSDGVLTRRL